MVSVSGMFILATFMLSLAFPAWGLTILNLGIGYVFEDYNVTGHNDLGNPIVGAPFDSSYPGPQYWGAEPAGPDPDGIRLLRPRKTADGDLLVVGAHVDGLEGQRFTAQARGHGSAFLIERPFGNGTEVYAFTFAYAYPKLAITTSTVPNKPLYLARYDPLNKYQHWIFTGPPPTPSQTAGPIDPKSLPTASLADALAASEKF